MTKQQKLGACLGGAFGVAVLALGWFLYSAYADHQAALEGDEEEGTKGLNAAMAENQGYYSRNPFPSDGAIAAVNSNRMAYVAWKSNAVGQCSRGDIPDMPEGLDGDSFKVNYLDVTLKKMQQLPGRVGGHICAENVWFGFEKYMPPDNRTPRQEDTPRLYKQFVTVTNIVDVLLQCGVLEIQRIGSPEKEANEDEAQGANQRGRARRGGNGRNAAQQPSDAPACYDYDLTFKARASVLVKVMNALAASPRFYVVREFGFEHEGESLKSRLDRAGSASGGEERSSRSRRGRDREKKEAETGDVVNPGEEMLVHMKLSVYDFGRGSARDDADRAEGAPAGSKKEGE